MSDPSENVLEIRVKNLSDGTLEKTIHARPTSISEASQLMSILIDAQMLLLSRSKKIWQNTVEGKGS